MTAITRRQASKVAKYIELAADPAAEPNRVLAYAKDSGGISQLFARTDDGTVQQLTPVGGFPAGAVATPGLPVLGDLDTGFYSPGADQLSIAVGGVQAARFLLNGVTGEGQLDIPQLGSAADPSVRLGQADTGLYAPAAGQVGISGGGIGTVRFTSTQILCDQPGSAGAPSYSWNGDSNTGINNSAADTMRFVTGGAARFEIDANVAADETALMVSIAGAAGLVRVSVGANDSGGLGFRLLRVPN